MEADGEGSVQDTDRRAEGMIPSWPESFESVSLEIGNERGI